MAERERRHHILQGGLSSGEMAVMGEKQPSHRTILDWALYLKCVCERRNCNGFVDEDWDEEEEEDRCPYALSQHGDMVRCIFRDLVGSIPESWIPDRQSGLDEESDAWCKEGKRYDMFTRAGRGEAPWPKEYTMSKTLKYTTSFWALSEKEALERARGEVYADHVSVEQDWTVKKVEDPDEEEVKAIRQKAEEEADADN